MKYLLIIIVTLLVLSSCQNESSDNFNKIIKCKEVAEEFKPLIGTIKGEGAYAPELDTCIMIEVFTIPEGYENAGNGEIRIRDLLKSGLIYNEPYSKSEFWSKYQKANDILEKYVRPTN